VDSLHTGSGYSFAVKTKTNLKFFSQSVVLVIFHRFTNSQSLRQDATKKEARG